MADLQLPHTRGCLVCGRDNTHGLRLDLYVADSGVVSTGFQTAAHHIGFDDIVHGGLLATVLDEVMVWAASWAARRFCVCAEMTVRFLQTAAVGEHLRAEAQATSRRPRLLLSEGKIIDRSGKVMATASGKYMPMSESQHHLMLDTFIDHPETQTAARTLRGSA